MDLINWSLNAIDQIYSTRKGGSGEPACPDGSYPAGYVMDSYGKFQLLCLANLNIEDVEDVYLTVLMITGHLLIGMGIALVYRKICKTAGAPGAPRLPVMLIELSKAVAAQSGAINDLRRLLTSNSGNIELVDRKVDLISDRLLSQQADRKMDTILDKLQDLRAVVASMSE